MNECALEKRVRRVLRFAIESRDHVDIWLEKASAGIGLRVRWVADFPDRSSGIFFVVLYLLSASFCLVLLDAILSQLLISPSCRCCRVWWSSATINAQTHRDSLACQTPFPHAAQPASIPRASQFFVDNVPAASRQITRSRPSSKSPTISSINRAFSLGRCCSRGPVF